MQKVQIGSATLYHGDCMDLMKTLDDNAFELAIVDPPYGIDINVSMGRRRGNKPSDYHKFAGLDKSIPDENYFNQLIRCSLNQVVWGGNYMTEYLSPSSAWLFWDKGFSEKVTFAQFEMAWTSFTTSAKKFELNAASNRNRIHPTQKPVALYEWLLTNYAKQGDKMLDTHLGSGSSAIAANKLGFEFVGIELDKDYFDAACKRIEKELAQGDMFAEPPKKTIEQGVMFD